METTVTVADDTAALRAEYCRIANRSHAESLASFNAAVCREFAARGIVAPTPADWVRIAKVTRIPCRECGGTGKFITGSVNGRLVGPGGDHYRCQGKGWRDASDERRNYGYDIHQKVI